jgi:hypothetical protein
MVREDTNHGGEKKAPEIDDSPISEVAGFGVELLW